MGRRLDGAPVLEPFLERRQVRFHPALVQSDGFQSFLHAPHLRAALLQTGEETLHLDNTQVHTNVLARSDLTRRCSINVSHYEN